MSSRKMFTANFFIQEKTGYTVRFIIIYTFSVIGKIHLIEQYITGKTHFNSNWEIWVIRTIQLNITWYILYIPVYIYIYHNCTWDNIHLNTKCMGQSNAKDFVTVSGTIHPNSIKNGTIHPNSYWEQMVIPLIAMVVYNVQYLQSPS